VKVYIIFENLVLVTENERKIEPCAVLPTENEGVSHLGLDYVIMKTYNNQKVQGE
jgi:hypothetical protein